MLEKLLEEIRRQGTIKPAVLANQLNTSPAMVEMMLEQLERMGLLARVDTECNDTCGSCPISDSCRSNLSPKSRLWMLKEEKV